MSGKLTVAISEKFLDAFAELPRQVQGKVTTFMNKFRNNPLSSGLNYEKLRNCRDSKLCSVRLDDTYRAIVVRQPETGVYMLLWVDHHDEAYKWAENKHCEVNPTTGVFQVFETDDTVENKPESTAVTAKGIFVDISDDDLKKLGVPEIQLSFIKRIVSKEQFLRLANKLSKDVYENLSWLVEGFELEEVLKLVCPPEPIENPTNNIAVALENPTTRQSFYVIEGEDELRKIMAEPLAKWRVFLHPTQRKIVNKKYSGPARVLGGAGTGKTVVAMHRAKYLASILVDNQRILFTTFTANLAGDIKDNLKKICSLEEMRKIDVINIDAWIARFLKEHEFEASIEYDDEKIRNMFSDAITDSGVNLELDEDFYIDEWNRVVTPQEAYTKELYLKASRIGRGKALDRKKRIEVFKVFESYMNLMVQRRKRDVNRAMYECKVLLDKQKGGSGYKYVVVDEAQDLSNSAFKLLRSIAGEKHENDMFIVGDAHQRIYKNYATLGKSGVDIRGRSSILKINYRTTEEIRKYAFALLNGISFDDLDDGKDAGDKCKSLTHGIAPEIKSFNGINEETEFIVSEIKKLIEQKVSLNNICIVARTDALLADYENALTKEGIRHFRVKRTKSDDPSFEGVRTATMHRVKGLEFRYVFAVAINAGIMPLNKAINHSDKVAESESMTSERCLFYVALTRARNGAYITSYGKKSEFLK